MCAATRALPKEHPIVQKIAAIAVEADEEGFRHTALALTLYVRCVGMPSPIIQRLVNTCAMLVDTILYAINGDTRHARKTSKIGG